jgi:hypothetical protein
MSETKTTVTKDIPIKRGRGRPRKDNNKQRGATGNYFAPVEKHLMEYLNSEDDAERNLIFNKYLYSPIYYMIQTILMRYYNNKFQIDESVDDIISDVFSFIVTKLDKFDPEMGFKAYSYIQTVIKHYIGSKYLNYDKKVKRYLSIGDVYNDIKNKEYEDEKKSLTAFKLNDNSQSTNDILPINNDNAFVNELFKCTIRDIQECIEDPEKYGLNEKDCNVGMCLIQILSDWENIISDVGSHKFNKTILLRFITESTFLDIKVVKNSIKKYKLIYQNTKKNLLNIY